MICAMRIVCFGDSLTEGYQSVLPEPAYTPYGRFLQALIGHRGDVIIRGVCGETTPDMRGRYRVDVVSHRPTHVVILGGTNDLIQGFSPASVIENLLWLYEEADSNGIVPVGMTIPSLGGQDATLPWLSSLEQAIQDITMVNQALTAHCAAKSTPLVDVFTATCDPSSRELAAKYSEDGVHLTTSGYRLMADMLWRGVFRSIAGNGMRS